MGREEFETRAEEGAGPDLRGSDYLKAAIYDYGRRKRGERFYHSDVVAVIQEASNRREQADAPQEQLAPRRSPRPKPGAEVLFISKMLVEDLKTWAEALRQQSEFNSPHPPYPDDLDAAADYIARTSAADRLRWGNVREDCEEDEQKIRQLADRLGVDVSIKYRFLPYSRPGGGHQKTAAVFPDTFLYKLAGEVNKVSKRTGFRPDALTMHLFTGAMPLIPRVWKTEREDHPRLRPGKQAHLRSVTLTFRTADLTFKELRTIYDGIKTYMGGKGVQALTLEDFELWKLVDRAGDPPEAYNGVRAFWLERLGEWNRKHSERQPLKSWEGLQDRYERICGRLGV